MNAAQSTVRDRLLAARIGPLHGGGLWGVVLVVLAFLAISIPQYGDPYVIDEAVFPYVAQGILLNGAPIFYNGETRPADIGLWHPPLYDYLLAGFVGIFGFSPYAVRAFGAVCVIAAFVVLAFAMKRLAPSLPQGGYVALAALVLLNPLVISGALVPDIDGTLGFVLVCGALWLAAYVIQEALSWRFALTVTSFAVVAASTKFTLAGFVAIIVGVAALLATRQRWRKTGVVVAAFAVGTALAIGLLALAGVLIGFDARAPFDYLFGSLGSRTPGRAGLLGALTTFSTGPGSSLVWIGPALMVATLVAVALVLVRRPEGVNRPLVVLSAGAGFVIVFGYSYISGSPFAFPKYTPIAVPAFALAVAALVTLIPRRDPAARRDRRNRLVAGLFAAALGVGTAGMFVIAARNERIHHRTLDDLALLTVAAYVAVVLTTAVVLVVNRDSGLVDLRRVVALSAIAALVITPVMTQISVSLVTATAPYATRYYYGERGMALFLERADRIIPPGAELIAAKDIGLQLDRPFYEDAILLTDSVDEFRDEVERIRAPYFVTRELHDYSESVFPDHFDVVREYYTPILEDDDVDFVLWELKDR